MLNPIHKYSLPPTFFAQLCREWWVSSLYAQHSFRYFRWKFIKNFFSIWNRMMTKHAQNRKRFGRRNFKQRYFRLTTQSLSYSKAKGKRPLCDIPLTELLDVERLEDRSFKMQNIFRVSSELLNHLSSWCAQTTQLPQHLKLLLRALMMRYCESL